jgi:hypothetical protein
MPNAKLVFTDTGWEFPHVYEHIDRFENVTGRAVTRLRNKSYSGIPEYIKVRHFMPNHGARYCTAKFKIFPMNDYLPDGVSLNIALRADEPERKGNLSENITIRYPLREMGLTRVDVVKICIEHDLLPRYPIYAARGGCVGCFYKRKSEVQAMAALVPDVLDELRQLEEAVQDERGKYFHMFPNVGMRIRDIQAQPLLFDAEQVYASAYDISDYGAACGLFCNR